MRFESTAESAPLLALLDDLLQRKRGGQGIHAGDFHDAMRLYVGDNAPPIPEERLATARLRLRDLYEQWAQLPPGETLELTFAI